jgi:hypothetical protein
MDSCRVYGTASSVVGEAGQPRHSATHRFPRRGLETNTAVRPKGNNTRSGLFIGEASCGSLRLDQGSAEAETHIHVPVLTDRDREILSFSTLLASGISRCSRVWMFPDLLGVDLPQASRGIWSSARFQPPACAISET